MGYDTIDTNDVDNAVDGNITTDRFNAFSFKEVSTFGNIPAIDPPQLAYVTGEEEYYSSTPQSGLFDIATASFQTSINAQDAGPSGIAWNNDGTRLYEVGLGGDRVYQSTVSTPYDITTASFDTSINTQGSGPTGMAFNNDGTRLYVVNNTFDSNSAIEQSTLSTPFDIATASFDTSINTQDDFPEGIAWNDDGSRLYEVTRGPDVIYQLTVSTPFDITTASFETSINAQDGRATDIAWNNDGTRLYESGQSGDRIYQSTVSTPFDIATASFDTSINGQDDSPVGIAFNNDGTRLYEVGGSADRIYQYTVSTGGWEAL